MGLVDMEKWEEVVRIVERYESFDVFVVIFFGYIWYLEVVCEELNVLFVLV